MSYTADDLLAFEADIADAFSKGLIKAPVHLGGGNEFELIEIFKTVGPDDYILGGWRSHYHCLLKGIPPAKLKAAILEGRSVGLCFPEHKILCSGIVGGVAPIAVGLAWSLKRLADESPAPCPSVVHCFLGDMSAESGIVHESMKYAHAFGLPVRWIIEDNGLSVCTDTQAAWGLDRPRGHTTINHYRYSLTRPHCGIGRWVRF